MDPRDKLKIFLKNKIDELSNEIKKLKHKNLFIQIMYGSLLVISITSATVITIIAPLGVAPLIIACVASVSGVSTIFSMKFGLKRKKEKLSCAIRRLNIMKDKLDYVVSCNGSMTEEECNNILKEFREK
jgi:cobalamin biosynthesis protein CobD/CbiB